MGALLAREPPSKFDSQVVQGAEWYTDVYGGDGFSQVRALTRLGIRAVFGGDELWRAKPALIKDIIRGGQSSRPRHLTVVGDGRYFAATQGDAGRELWWTDGTYSQTRLVTDVVAGARSSQPVLLTRAGGRLLRDRSRGLVSDGRGPECGRGLVGRNAENRRVEYVAKPLTMTAFVLAAHLAADPRCG